MSFMIVSDSSSNVLSMGSSDYTTVPLKIIAEKEYVDDAALDLAGMMEDLRNHKGKSGSSCPNVGEWLDAFGDAEEVFCVTISRNLSGSFASSVQAGEAYMSEHPGRKVFTFDSLAVGPEMGLLIDKIRQCEAEGDDYETTKAKVLEYHNHLHTVFCLESMLNLARNGREHGGCEDCRYAGYPCCGHCDGWPGDTCPQAPRCQKGHPDHRGND